MAGRNVRQYIYTSVSGKPRLRKIRRDPKAFFMQSWIGGDHEYWGDKIRREQEHFAEKAMYHLPELVWALRAGEPVWWCEGEKDADAIRGVGGYATSHWQGAGHATRDQAKWFVGSSSLIRLVVDVDKSGCGAQCVIARKRLLLSAGVARSRIRIVAPPHPHKDAAAAIEVGLSLSRFRRPDEALLTAAADGYTSERRQRRESSDWMGRAS